MQKECHTCYRGRHRSDWLCTSHTAWGVTHRMTAAGASLSLIRKYYSLVCNTVHVTSTQTAHASYIQNVLSIQCTRNINSLCTAGTSTWRLEGVSMSLGASTYVHTYLRTYCTVHGSNILYTQTYCMYIQRYMSWSFGDHDLATQASTNAHV